MQGSMLYPTFAKGLGFSCTKCGACCRHVGKGIGLREKDVTRLGNTSHVKTSHPIFVETLSSSNGTCSHLSVSSECEVYLQRPLVCRLYPFYLSVGGDGSIQISVDHCPGVNLPDAELVDQDYISREILPSLLEDPEFLSTLQREIVGLKKSSYALIPDGDIMITWRARKVLWKGLFDAVKENLRSSFSPRDALEVLKVDLVPYVENLLISRFSDSILDIAEVEQLFSEDIPGITSGFVELQHKHRIEIQKKGEITSGSKVDNPSTTFRRRNGKSFSVPSKALLKMRNFERDAISTELAYIEEVIQREFVFSGVMVEPLSLRQEVSLLFYLADAIELTANALSILENQDTISAMLINQAICEVDASILNTVRLLGGTVATIPS